MLSRLRSTNRRAVAFIAGVSLVFGAVSLAVAPSAGAAAASIKVSPASAGPGAWVEISGSNWTPSVYVYTYIVGVEVCALLPNSSGTIPPTACQVPDVAKGKRVLTAEQNSSATTATTSLTIVPRVTYISASGLSSGGTTTLDVGGLKASSPLKAYLDSTTSTKLVTSPASPSTDPTGTINSLVVTMPSGATAGTHSLLLVDSAGDTASKSVVIYQPTLSVTPKSGGPGSYVTMSGSGWRPSDYVYIYAGTGSFCSPEADSSGAFSTVCTVPTVPAGAQALTAEQDSSAITSTPGTFTITPRVSYLPEPAVSPGGTIPLQIEGLAASSAVTASLAGSTGNLVTNPASPVTDTNGDLGSLQVTIPAAAKAGNKVLTIEDASGDKATTTLAIYKPKGVAGATSGHAGVDVQFSGSGFQPAASLYIYMGATYFCSATTDVTGAFSTYCQLPSYVPAGSAALTYQQDSGAVVASQTFTMLPTLTFPQSPDVTGGASIEVNAYALAATSSVTATLSGVSGNLVTNPADPTTDSNGTLSDLVVTIPASAAAGNHTLTLSDGTNKATATVTLFAPKLTLTETTGSSGTTFGYSGSGWWPSNGVYLYFGSTYACGVTADGSGNVSGNCTVPTVAAGPYAVSAQENSDAINLAVGTFTVTS